MPLSDSHRAIYASNTSNEILLDTIEILQGSTTICRVVQDKQDLTATLEDSYTDTPAEAGTQVLFTQCPFSFTPGAITESGSQKLQITISNIGSKLITAVQQASQSGDILSVIYRRYVVGDTSAPVIDPPQKMVISNIVANLTQITATGQLPLLANTAFPKETYRLEDYPSLRR